MQNFSEKRSLLSHAHAPFMPYCHIQGILLFNRGCMFNQLIRYLMTHSTVTVIKHIIVTCLASIFVSLKLRYNTRYSHAIQKQTWVVSIERVSLCYSHCHSLLCYVCTRRNSYFELRSLKHTANWKRFCDANVSKNMFVKMKINTFK